MSTSRIRFLGLIFGLLALVAMVGFSTVNVRRTIAADSNDSKLSRLLHEKVAILKQDVDHLERLHKLGEAGFEELFSAHLALYRARLDLCETDQARIEILERLLDEAKRREAAVAALGGVSSSLTKHRAQVDRLDIEIQLERIRSK